VARAVLAALAAALLLPAGASADATPAAAIEALNAQRTANGIPAGITENPQWSADCAAHNDYERQNGGGLVHGEEMGKPGYTTGGDDASNGGVLASGSSWSGGNPWETAPVHLMQLLAPRLKSSGVADGGGYVCQTTWLGMDYGTGPAANVVSTYPGDGATNWRGSEVAAEGPFTPGDKLGLPQPTRTGPYIYALLDGPGQVFNLRSKANLTTATLTGPSGDVPLKTLDSTNAELGPYMVPGAYLIPVSPLADGKYTGNVTFTVDGAPVSRTWSFTVGSGGGPTPTPTPTPGKPALKTTTRLPSKVKGGTLSGTITCSAACRVTLTLTAKGFKKAIATKTYTAKKAGKLKVKLKLSKSVRRKVKKAKLKISAKNLAGGTSPKTSTTTVKFSR
jgi:hypothetical protein